MSNALTVSKGNFQLSTPIDSNEVIRGIGGMMNCSPQHGAVILMTCMQENITPIDFIRKYHMIKGKPSMQAKAMLAEFRRIGGKHKVVEQSPTRAAIELTFEGQTNLFELTWEDAKESRWPWKDVSRTALKDNWSTNLDRQNMLWARVVSTAVDAVAPEVSHGVYTPEEMEDVDTTPTDMPATGLEDEVDDAEFEVKEDPRPEPPAEPEPKEEAAAEEVETEEEEVETEKDVEVEAEAENEWDAKGVEPWELVPACIPDNTISGHVRKEDRKTIRELISKLIRAGELTPESCQQSFEDRQITAMNQLTKEQAKGIIEALEAMLQDL